MLVVGYTRVSTDNQTDGYGLDAQINTISEYCSNNGMEIVNWYSDTVSGVSDDRPSFNEILYGEVKNPPIEAVIVAKSDRIARDIKLYYYYLMLLEKKGIRLISATEELVNDESGLGNIYKALMLFVAEQERKNIVLRTKCGRNEKANKGGYAGGRPPYGYRSNKGELEIVEEEAKVVREIFRLKSLNWSYSMILEKINETHKARNGKKFLITTLRSIISREEFYKGEYQYGENDKVKGKQEAIL